MGISLLIVYSGEHYFEFFVYKHSYCMIDESKWNLPCPVGKEWCSGHLAIRVHFTGVVVPNKKVVMRAVQAVRIVFILTVSAGLI